jgi:hypothetical protein
VLTVILVVLIVAAVVWLFTGAVRPSRTGAGYWSPVNVIVTVALVALVLWLIFGVLL